MLRLLVFLCAFLFSGSSVFAADHGPAPMLGIGDVMRGHFHVDHFRKGSDKPLRSEGHFVLAPDYGLIWSIERPVPFTFVVTALGMTQMIGNIPLMFEPAASAATFTHLTAMVCDVMSGNWAVLDKDFNVSRTGDAQKWRVKLTPRLSSEVSKLARNITVSGGRFLDAAEVLEASESIDKVVFQEVAVSAAKPTETEAAMFNYKGH